MLSASKSAAPSGAYTLTNSLRFRRSASANLTRTPASSTNRQKWTFSFWYKRGQLGTQQGLFESYVDTSNITSINMNNDQINIQLYGNGPYNTVYNSTAVFRDPSAWYHIVVVLDTTQTSQANMAKLYVNGVQQTFSYTNYGSAIPQNYNGYINNTNLHYIGLYAYNGSYQDGYLTEVNFIDGQALTPSSFGSTNATTGVWQPARYTGTYGTNGFYLPFTNYTSSVYAGYSTNMSTNYNTLPTSGIGTNFQFTGNFTIEGWVLYPTASVDSSMYVIGDGSTYLALNIDMSTGVYNIYCNSNTPSGSFTSNIPLNNWTHVAMVRNGSTITLYTNGVAKGTITSAGTLGYTSPTLNRFGGASTAARYMSNVRITKSAVYTANFIPPSASLTNIANTIVLTYQDSSAIDNSSNAWTIGTVGSMTFPGGNVIFNADIFSDRSGNANSWTPNNINYSFYGTTYDSMTDVPTLTSATVANYAVMNPLWKDGTTVIAQGNLDVSNGNYGGFSTLTIPTNSKFYAEFTVTATQGNQGVGILKAANAYSGVISQADMFGSNSVTYYSTNGNKFVLGGGSTAYGSSWGTIGDVIGIAVNTVDNQITFYKNNTSQGVITGLTSGIEWVFATGNQTNTGGGAWNFGQRPFSYTPPTGFNRLNAYNLPDSTIVKGNSYMDATLYTGNGTSQTITTASSFKPDLVWIKGRDYADFHTLFDTVRGATKSLSSNLTTAEVTRSTALTAFTSTGFTVGSDTLVNYNGHPTVAWQWQAGQGTTSSNTNGSVTSTTSVNATAGFSIVSYTEPASGSYTVGHGLGVAPKMIILRERPVVTNWLVWNSYWTPPTTRGLYLNGTNAAFTTGSNWLNSVTSSVFGITVGQVTGGGSTTIAYCFAEIAGFSKFGSYTGNGSTDGTFVYTGFRPKYVLIKLTSAAGYDWYVYDTARETYNVAQIPLFPNLTGAESANSAFNIDILSNGFKCRATYAGNNGSSSTYIYMAFAENPFKNALAR